jgi:hypothetical protein
LLPGSLLDPWSARGDRMHVDRETAEAKYTHLSISYLFYRLFQTCFQPDKNILACQGTQFDYNQSQMANRVISLCGNSVSSNHPS